MDKPVETLAAVLAQIDGARLTELLVDAVEQYSPSYAEEPAMEIFAAALSDAGLAHLRQPIPERTHGDTHGNLIVELGPQPAALMLVGHVDTVPVIGEEEPSTQIDGDLLHGLGTADMKSGCAAMVEALGAIARAGVPLSRGLAVALVVGEEEYGDGSEALLTHMSAPLTVIGEPTGLVPCLDHYGYHEIRLQSRGAQVHAALPELGASAIHAMLSWLTAMLEEAQRPPYAEKLAMNPRDIAGGSDMFVVAEHCEALVDIHGVPEVDAVRVRALVEAARERAAAGHPGCSFDYEQLYAAPGYTIDAGSAALAPLHRAFTAVGQPWQPAPFRSHSDGSMYRAKGSVPVICGPGRLEVAHTRHEHVSLTETEQAARLYAAMIHEACVA